RASCMGASSSTFRWSSVPCTIAKPWAIAASPGPPADVPRSSETSAACTIEASRASAASSPNPNESMSTSNEQSPSRCVYSAPGASKECAPSRSATASTSSRATNRNWAPGSMKRRINHGHATRSTFAFSRVTHFMREGYSMRGRNHRSSVRGDPHFVAERVGEDAEADARDLLSRLDDRPAELLRLRECRRDVVDADEEQDGVGPSLQRTDRGRERSLSGACVGERVAGERAVAVRPAEHCGEEFAGRVGIRRADLGVDDGMSHGGPPPGRGCTYDERAARKSTTGLRGPACKEWAEPDVAQPPDRRHVTYL